VELSFSARNVLLGASVLGVMGGVLGSFALLRRQSLLGDALAHAALPGVCLGYMLTRSKQPAPLLAGALVAGVVGALLILALTRWSRIKQDSAIGIVLSVFFGFGIVLLTHIQKLPYGNQSGLDKFLFGQAATLMPRDVALMSGLGLVVLVVTMLFFKELKMLCFDADYGASLGFSMRALEVLLTLLLVTVVVVGLQTVGVVLMVATLITPAAAARQWTQRLGVMVLLSALIGGSSGAVGALVSASVARLPTGPVIVLCSSAVLVLSLAVAPSRGLVWAWLAQRRVAMRIRRENLLKDLYAWYERRAAAPLVAEPVGTAAMSEATTVEAAAETGATAVPWSFVMGTRGQTSRELLKTARRLASRRLVSPAGRGIADGLRLTPEGFEAAEAVVRKHRLWELYLTRRLELPSDHVHRDAETMEHALDEAAVAQLEEVLGFPATDPHGQPIPRRRSVA
jgi:manganese/zinc/iron transport system permease protein